ncbi:MAG: hypothetical protein JNL28_02865 [Planctomycetes bacterium]|nr:hypothetical protein [Planctomycetota bacterium]
MIGNQAILGQFPDAPRDLLRSMEADVYPKNKPELADLIDGSIGEGSPFHTSFGYYAQGVGENTAVLPRGWQERVFVVRSPATRGTSGLCLEVHDLLISKLVAGREKDLEFGRVAASHGLIDGELLRARLVSTDLAPSLRAAVLVRISRIFDGRA